MDLSLLFLINIINGENATLWYNFVWVPKRSILQWRHCAIEWHTFTSRVNRSAVDFISGIAIRPILQHTFIYNWPEAIQSFPFELLLHSSNHYCGVQNRVLRSDTSVPLSCKGKDWTSASVCGFAWQLCHLFRAFIGDLAASLYRGTSTDATIQLFVQKQWFGRSSKEAAGNIQKLVALPVLLDSSFSRGLSAMQHLDTCDQIRVYN